MSFAYNRPEVKLVRSPKHIGHNTNKTRLHFSPFVPPPQMEYVGCWSQTRKERLSPVQATTKINYRLVSLRQYVQQFRGVNHKCGLSAAISPVEGTLFHEDRRMEMARQIVTIRISNATEKMRRLMKMRFFKSSVGWQIF
jgi:hypothetical protein